jgi:hypothetical protein
MKSIVYDLDGTLCSIKTPSQTYADVDPIQPMIDQLNAFKAKRLQNHH